MPRTLGILIENYVAGGSDVIANRLSRHLAGWGIVILSNQGNDDRNLLKDLDSRIRVVRYGFPTLAEFGQVAVRLRERGYRVTALFVRVFNLLARYPHIAISALYFAWLFKKQRLDVLISNNGGYPGGEMCRAAVFAAKLRRIPSMMIVHSMPMKPSPIVRPFEALMDRLVGRSTTVVAVTEAIAAQFECARSLNQRAAVIENAVEEPTLAIAETPSQPAVGILCVGAISPWKNQIGAVATYRKLLEMLAARRPDIATPSLTFIGPVADEAYRIELEKAAALAPGEAGRIILAGYQDLPPYFAQPRQLLLMTSEIEGLPLVLLEAMSYGVPAVATRVGGIPSVISDGVNGRTCAAGDVAGLAEALFDYLTDAEHYRQASRSCLWIFQEKYTLRPWIARYQAALARLCAEQEAA